MKNLSEIKSFVRDKQIREIVEVQEDWSEAVEIHFWDGTKIKLIGANGGGYGVLVVECYYENNSLEISN